MRVSLFAPQNASTTNRRLLDSSLTAMSLTAFQVSSDSGMVVVLVLVGGPPHGVLGVVVHDDELVFGGAAGVDAGHNVDGAQLADLALFVALQTGLGLLLEEHLVGRIVYDLGGAGDAILAQIQMFHRGNTSLSFALSLGQHIPCYMQSASRYYYSNLSGLVNTSRIKKFLIS